MTDRANFRRGARVARIMRPFAALLLVCTAPMAAPCAEMWSSKVHQVRSKGGITAWLSEDHAHPVVAIRFAFSGGTTREPAGKRGMSEVLAEWLGEGGGAHEAQALKSLADRLATRISYSAGRDALMGSVDTLSRNLDATEDILVAGINAPLDDEAVLERVVRRRIAAVRELANDPATVAEDAWYATAFGDHPYAAASSGPQSTLGSLTVRDIAEFKSRLFARGDLTIVASGDITAERLGNFVDRVFGSLPGKTGPEPLEPAALRGGERVVLIDGEHSEASVAFGFAAVPRRDPDFMAALVLNEILGGAAMASRLGAELRERQGLVYAIETRLIADAYAAYVLGQFTTQPDRLSPAVAAVREVMSRLARDGASDEEVESVKTYLIGAFPLSFDSSPKIADNLIAIAQAGLGPDYVGDRQRAIAAVTKDAVSRMAARLLSSDGLAIAIARGRQARE